MIDKLKFDSFYVFLVSLGMLLICLPIGVICYIYKSDIQMITEAEYEVLSDYTKDMLLIKQQLIIDALDKYRLICVLSSLVGVVMVAVGAYKWRETQAYLDKQEKSKAELMSLEVQEKMTKGDIAGKTASKIACSKSSEEQNKESNPININNEAIDSYINMDNLCFDYIEAIYNKNFDFKYIHRIKIGLCRYDMIAKSKNDDGDILFEIRYDITDKKILNSEIDDLRMKRLYYSETTGRISSGYIVIVLSDEKESFEYRKKQIMTVNQPADVHFKVFRKKDLINQSSSVKHHVSEY